MDLNDIFGPDKPIDLVTPEDVAVGEYIYGNVPVYRSIPGTQSYGFSPFSMMVQSSQADFRDDMSLTSCSMWPANETCSTAIFEEQIVSSHANSASLKEQIGSVQVNYDCVPEQPSFLVPTHFEIRTRIEEITLKINHYLLINPTISFEFSSSGYQWDGIIVKGSSNCKFTVNIYQGSNNCFLVEANRLKGDSSSFHPFFKDLKAELLGMIEHRSSEFAGSSPMSFEETLSDEDALEAMKPLVVMANESNYEAHLAASTIICDLSYRGGFERQFCDSDLFKSMANLLKSSHDCIRLNIVQALTVLSKDPSCQDAICSSDILPTIFELSVNGNYLTSELHRSATVILANLCRFNPAKVTDKVSEPVLTKWLASVDDFIDSRLKLHASNAKACLLQSITV